MDSKLYYEVHVTVNKMPKDTLLRLCSINNYKASELKFDDVDGLPGSWICTYRGKNQDKVMISMLDFIQMIISNGGSVVRYKIEDTILDSKLNDSLFPLVK